MKIHYKSKKGNVYQADISKDIIAEPTRRFGFHWWHVDIWYLPGGKKSKSRIACMGWSLKIFKARVFPLIRIWRHLRLVARNYDKTMLGG